MTTRKDDNDGTDQNEKVRRLLEETGPSQLNESLLGVKAQSLSFLALDPGSQGQTHNNIFNKK